MPRVISGRCGGMILDAPKGLRTRPTADKVKEALFSILQSKLVDADFLDLFSGSGQIGIEAVSRGARSAYLTEADKNCWPVIRKNIEKTGFGNEITLLQGDVFRSLEVLADKKLSFSIIYMDPPYDLAVTYLEKIVPVLLSRKLLKKGGFLIAEHRSSQKLSENVMNLTFYRCCKYGSAMLTFYTTGVD